MRRQTIALNLLMVVGLAGCGSANSSENPAWPKRFPASGTVRYQGQPVENADVVFASATGNSTGVAKTDANGHFRLKTHIEGDGVVAGSHVVTIRRVEVIDKNPPGIDLSTGAKGVPPVIKWIVPEKYSLPARSGLKAEVSEVGSNEFTFDLK
jgi:hypothetical protein